MDYFDDVFNTFLDLDRVNYLAVNGTVTSLIRNILDCVLKTNEAFMGLERHAGFILGWSNLLMNKYYILVDTSWFQDCPGMNTV